jgi:Fe-S cluster assembly iron-binding protein IscA
MALDEPKEDDQVFNEGGIKYAINKGLYDQVKPIQVDFIQTPRGAGYRVTGNIAAKSCGSCSC